MESLKVHQKAGVYQLFQLFYEPMVWTARAPADRVEKKLEKLEKFVNISFVDEFSMTPKLKKLEELFFTSFSCFCEDMVWTSRAR